MLDSNSIEAISLFDDAENAKRNAKNAELKAGAERFLSWKTYPCTWHRYSSA